MQDQKESQQEEQLISKEYFRDIDLDIFDFELGETLGTGTFGIVKDVTFKHLETKRDNKTQHFALKIIPKSQITKENQQLHINNERNILNKLDHPFIIELLADFQDEDFVYFLFKKEEGGELFLELTKRKRFSEKLARFFISEILLALSYLHKEGIMYRDLKPENIILDENGHSKLIDFGFSKEVKDNRTYTLCGTPEYIAPEVLIGRNKGYTKGIDWWALGVFIFELLAG